MVTTTQPAKEAWHLDKRVPLALIGSLFAQTLGMGWWAASLQANVRDHERRILSMETHDRIATDALAAMKADVAVLLAGQGNTLRQLDRLERLLETRAPLRQ